MDSVADIQLEPGVKQKGEIGYGLPGRIVVKLKKHTPYAPLLTLLDPYYAGVTVERGPMFDWIFIISYEGQAGTVVEGKCRYRLELL